MPPLATVPREPAQVRADVDVVATMLSNNPLLSDTSLSEKLDGDVATEAGCARLSHTHSYYAKVAVAGILPTSPCASARPLLD